MVKFNPIRYFKAKYYRKIFKQFNLKNTKVFSFEGLNTYAKVVKIYDCDTFNILIYYNEKIIRLRIRLARIDSPEIKSNIKKERDLAIRGRDYYTNKLMNKVVFVKLGKNGKFGRPLTEVYYKHKNQNDEMVDFGYAVNYFGGKKKSFEINNLTL